MNADHAVAVLRANDLGSCTIPARGLYPHQWNWDSAFAALGWATIDPQRAWVELESLCGMAHPDGMIPHIAFADGDGYMPGPEWWASPLSRDGRRTSGITQPPVAATCLRMVHDSAPDTDRLRPLARALHRWHAALHDYRRWSGPDGSWEPIVVHPWESGRDNAIDYDAALAGVAPTSSALQRADTSHVAADQRPSDQEYRRYLALVEYFRDELRWDQSAMAGTSPVRVLDPLFSAVLARSCLDLSVLLAAVGDTRDAALERSWATAVSNSLAARRTDEGWVPALDLVNGPILQLSSGSAAALLAPDIDDEAVGATARLMAPGGPLASHLGVRSASPSAHGYSPQRYWRGPVWANVTWLCALGAEQHGRDELAGSLRDAITRLVDEVGFREYADPGGPGGLAVGLGADAFSWTAALALAVSADR